MIDKIKLKLAGLKENKIKIIVDVGRNKREEYIGKIDKLYNNVWTIKVGNSIKSFSYKDILIKSVIIKPL